LSIIADNPQKMIDTINRMVVTMDAAMDPNKYKEEYQKKLYKVLTGQAGGREAETGAKQEMKASDKDLLNIFFEVHDPTSLNRQGNDAGTQYRSGIYYSADEDRIKAQAVMSEVKAKFSKPLVTEVLPLAYFWPAEDYHQNYFQTHPFQGYCMAVVGPKVSKFKKTFQMLIR
jgi:peptide-methionine (S)-S-oxide reductase